MESIIIQSNQFTTFPNLEVIGSTLTHIDLSTNSINTVAENALDGLLVLEELNLASNVFTAFPDLTPVGATLLKLSINKNDLQVITSSDVEPLIILTELDVSINYNLIVEDLSPLGDTLDFFFASQCRETQFINTFHNFPKLSNLIIAGALQTEFPNLSTVCGKLTYINVRNNIINQVNTSSIDQCIALEHLGVENNKLTSVPNITATGHSLKLLNLTLNRIDEIDQDYMRAQTALETIEIAHNMLTLFPNVSRSGNTLTTIRLANNLITNISSTVMMRLVNLVSLDLGKNQLTSFPELIRPKLTFLVLSENRFTSLPDIQYLTSLTSLSVTTNPVTTSSPRIVIPYGKLQTVDLRNTELTELPTMCPKSSLTLLLENSTQLDLCSSKMAWFKQTFFTVIYTDVMCNTTGKMWSATSFDELLVISSQSSSQPGDVKRMYLT